MKSLLLAFLAALAAWAAFPPVGQGWLVLVAIPLLVLATLEAPSARMATVTGLMFGVAFMGLLMSWLSALGVEAMAGMVLSQALWFPLFTRVVWRFRTSSTGSLLVIVVGSWTAMEFARARFPFGGLNWGALGYPLGDLAAARSVAQYVGATGLEVVVVVVGAAIAISQVRRDLRVLGLAIGLGAVTLIIGLVSGHGPNGEAVQVAIVQGNSPCPQVHCPNERQLIFDNHLRLTRQIEPGSVDLILWAESASSFVGVASDPQAQLVAAEAKRIGATMLVGGDRGGTETTFINSNLAFAPDGRIVGEYLKTHPVPFGEFIPFRPLFGLIPVTAQVPRDMERGDGAEVVATPFGLIGSVISFEGAFARYGRDTVGEGAQVLLVASNESSYGESPAAAQFIDMTRMRAAENGVDVVHGAVTGSSVLITNSGELGEQSELFEETIVYGEIKLREAGPTLYTRWGDWLAILTMLAGAYAVMMEAMQSMSPKERSVQA